MGISTHPLEWLLINICRSKGIDGLDVVTSSEHNCTFIHDCPLFNDFVML
jgi:hypothetical protein